MMKRIIFILIFTLILAVSAFSSTRVDLNRGWHFRIDPTGHGEIAGWHTQLPGDVQSIDVPHTWNIGANASYVGKAWYFRTFDAPSKTPGTRTELHFGAAFYSARVWLNGVEIGRHEGGYTGFSFDISQQLRATNFLAVEIDNTVSASTIPGFALRGDDKNYDWWNYGGIVRDVWLSVGGSLQVRRQQIRSRIRDGAVTVEDRVYFNNKIKARQTVIVVLTAYDPDNRVAATQKKTIAMRPDSRDEQLPVEITTPKLWSIDQPNIYRMVAQIRSKDGRLLDEQSDTFGLRTVEIRDRHLLLNGERVRLTGLTRHEESLSEGLAEKPDVMRTDYDDLKNLQVTLTRPVHYPQNRYILDYADRYGILLIPEIPVWQFSEEQMKDAKVIALAKQQIREMIEESGNHPSIFAWSVCNESATGTPGGIAFFREMRDYIRSLDPDRYVSFADDNLPKLKSADESAAKDADFLMMNQYFGSWHGPDTALSAALDKVGAMFPDKMVIISEFGLPGLFADNAKKADEMRVRIIREQLPELAKRDWIAGAILWCYQDYKSNRNLRPGRGEAFVDHGVVDEKRQRKPSYYAWKDLNAPASVDAALMNVGSGDVVLKITVKPNAITDLPSYSLHDYKLSWRLSDDKGNLVASGEQQLSNLTSLRTISRTVSTKVAASSLRFNAKLARPAGPVAAEKIVDFGATDDNAKANSSANKQGAPAK